MDITSARRRALPAVIVLSLFALARVGAGVWLARSQNLPLNAALLGYGASAVVYAALAYGVFHLWRSASVASIAFVWWQLLVVPQALTRGAVLLSIVSAILATGVVASFRYRSNALRVRDDAAS